MGRRKASEHGIKIKNFQAGSVYQCNIGVRQNYDYTKAMFANNLLMYYLLKHGMKVENGWTRDLICMNFDYGSRSYDEEIKHLDKTIKSTEDEQKLEFLNKLKHQAELHKDLFSKKSADEIREIFYEHGVEIRHDVAMEKHQKPTVEYIHYKMLYRSTGKAKAGSCMFIRDELYDDAINYIRMGIKLDDNNAKIVEIGAYGSLIASAIVGTVRINPRDILILDDVQSTFNTNVLMVKTDADKHCYVDAVNDYALSNDMFDGQGLIDESVFPTWGNGYVLLRQHMTKMACFKTKIQKFFKDYYGENYLTATIKDMWGNEHNVKDVKLITTNNAVKWLKFNISYDYWCDKVIADDCLFGIVKTAHESKLGSVQKMSYQMVNSLSNEIMPNIIENSVNYVTLLKTDDDTFLSYINKNKNFSNDFECLYELCQINREFVRSEYFRKRKYTIIEQYIRDFRFGKIIQNGDNLVFVASPYAMLLYTVGENVNKDTTFTTETDAVQCFTTRFDDGTNLACFRSPHNGKYNIAHLHNVYSEEYFKYFDLGQQIIALNTQGTDIMDRLNG